MMRATGLFAVAVNSVLAYDYYKGWTDSERNRIMDSSVHEVPGFYDARTKAASLMAKMDLLDLSNHQYQIEAAKEWSIDTTCIELKE